VEWSPDGKRILFGTGNGDIQVFDHLGNFMNRLQIACLQGSSGLPRIVGIDWYNGAHGYLEPNCPCLVRAGIFLYLCSFSFFFRCCFLLLIWLSAGRVL
jgi:hypothetical protein